MKTYEESEFKLDIMDSSLSALVEHFINNKAGGKAKELMDEHEIETETFLYWKVRAHVQSANWDRVKDFIEKGEDCPVPMASVAEICISEGKKEDLALQALSKIVKPDIRIETMLEFQLWEAACIEIVSEENLQEEYLP